MMQRLFLALAAVSVVVALIVVSKQQVDRKQQLLEELEYRKYGSGVMVICDAEIMNFRGDCVPLLLCWEPDSTIIV